MKTKIEYNGSTIAYTEGSVIKLHCKDEKMVDDLTISVSGEGGGGSEGGTQLSAPSISLDGDILTIRDESGLATSFDILADGNVAKNIKAESIAVYALSGAWAFNPQPSCSFNKAYDITFTSNGTQYSSLYASRSADRIVYRKSQYDFAQAYEKANWTESRVIDFGDTPQRVSKEFYEWFTTNAAKARTLPDGAWLFNETPDLGSFPYSGESKNESVFVTFAMSTGGSRISKIVVTENQLLYVSSLETVQAYSSDNGWKFVRDMQFFDPQVVPEDVYSWFISNATKAISGTWRLNDQLEMPEVEISGSVTNFKIGDINFESMSVNPESLNVVSVGNHLTHILYINGVLTYPYRDVTITGTQYINGELYKWLVANATKWS